MVTDIVPFRIAVPDTDLDDLRDRLARARWPRALPGDGWSRGVPPDRLRALAGYWAEGYDWRAWEARLNAFPQFRTTIDGLGLHFLHVRSPDPGALPLLLAHGWPNSFVEFTDLIDLLTPHFHVVVPSVPGFGFSDAPDATGFSAARVGRMFATLMGRLGYERYGVQGGDLGAYIAPEVARADPANVVGVYVTAGLGMPSAGDADLTADEQAMLDMMAQWGAGAVDHHGLLRVAPQTFGYAWHDSPVGLLAWLAHKFHEFNPAIEAADRDLFLANAAVWWFTGTESSSSWPMYDTARFAWPVGQRLVPTGVYQGPPGSRRLAERDNHIVHWPESNPGGHFPAMEVPATFAADLRTFFLRSPTT